MTANPLIGGKRRRADAGFRFLSTGSGAVVLVVLGLIAITMTTKAFPVLQHSGLRFFTGRRWSPADKLYGAFGFLFGSLVSATIALTLAVPVSIGIALFITQVAPQRFRRPITYLLDLLAVVPSVVFGFWGIAVLSRHITGFYRLLGSTLGHIPFVGRLFGQPNGRSFFTAGIILGIMIIPIISSLSREVIDTCPATEREAAYGLGATRWEMIRGAVLPHAKGGLVGAVMLGLGRAMGETIAATLVIGSSVQVVANLFAPGDSMPAVIASQWGEADGLHKSALIGLAMTLFVITIAVNMIATTVVNRSTVRSQGAR
jgi:phosphate transport system permease protein